MKAIEVQCRCGAIELRISGEPIAQFYCHCDDCQTVHGAAYIPAVVYPAQAIEVIKGVPTETILRTTPRMRCPKCGAFLFSELTGIGLRSLSASLLPRERFKPQFHIQCQYAVLPIVDNLPHFKGFPPQYGGTDEVVGW